MNMFLTNVPRILLLIVALTPVSLQNKAADYDETNHWKEVKAGAKNAKFNKMAQLAIRQFTTAVDFYLAVNKLEKVQQKGQFYKLTFSYTPTRCPVTEVFEPELCVATSSKPTGKCQAFVTEKKKGPFVDWIDCEDFNKKEEPRRSGVQQPKRQRRALVSSHSSH
ncbi:hypothetical protein HPB52_014260 [Rhipicephalus sanguineus]|uniref:Cystatin n=1 Tax=Rhipicephalus sanguineus TaxID=34632 RepID=A0A9D4QB85_RHISA|nr:hypothetical protein HPB52_014260 [Rhipicephalus sanguineus]